MTPDAEAEVEIAAMQARWTDITAAIRAHQRPPSPEVAQEMAGIEAELNRRQIPLPDNVLPFKALDSDNAKDPK